MSEPKEAQFRFIDLFAGIGGFHIAMQSVGGECVFASEWDKFARITYEANFKDRSPELFLNDRFAGDINHVAINDIPDFDVLCAGFPCQPFSHAGLKKGFEDTRGTLFFKIAEIVRAKVQAGRAPKVLLLENVKGLKNHDNGNTLKRILEVLDDLGYFTESEVLISRFFGLPQNRERLYIIAWRKDDHPPEHFRFPFGIDEDDKPIFDKEVLTKHAKHVMVGDILIENVDPKYTISDRLWNGHLRRREEHRRKGNGFGYSLFDHDSPYTSTISARYYKDGSEILIDQKDSNPRKLDPKEAGRLQGFGETFRIVVSDVQAYKQFGNSVSIPVVETLAKEILRQLLNT